MIVNRLSEPHPALTDSRAEQAQPRAVSTSSEGLLSVIIPTRNRADLLRGAITSVVESPLITSPDQVIVVDDDSHDQTEQVARQFGVRYLHVACHSFGGSRNAGLALMQTTYVSFLDDDDAWLPGNMESQLAALQADPSVGFAYGIVRCATEDLQPLAWTYPSPPLASGVAPERLHLGYPQIGVVLFRREAITKVGGSDPRIRYHQDGDLMLRIAAQYEIVGVEVVGMLHRLRDPSRTRSDYHWANREVTSWWPRHVRVGWRTAAKFLVRTRGLFFGRFCEDATACIAHGHRHDGLICLSRALRISPAHAVRHTDLVGSILWACIVTRGN